ncbi:hypothetical protein T265_13804, partial [Opisthorchis viverrini]
WLLTCSPSLAIDPQTFRHHTRRHHLCAFDDASSYGDETFMTPSLAVGLQTFRPRSSRHRQSAVDPSNCKPIAKLGKQINCHLFNHQNIQITNNLVYQINKP